jgi:hypothetical protein
MALSATFTANFSSFYDAVDKAEIKLKEFGAGAENAGKRLSAMGNQFSGVKIIQDATLMAKAVEEIGGVAKLTDKELAKLGNTANEAVAKMKALGMDVPKNLQEIADKTKTANKATTDWMGSLTKIAGAVGIAFSVDAIVGFVGGLFEAASAIKDMSAQWGVSTKAVQQWTAAAKGSGVEAKTLGNTLQHMTTQMSEGSDLYKASLDNIGLSYEKLRKLPMEEQYKQVIAAIQGVQDETLQLDIAIGILGPNAKQMIGAIRDGFIDAADAQNFMADTTIQRLTDAQAKWKDLADKVTIYSADMLSVVMGTTERMTNSWGNFFTFAKLAIAVQLRLTGQVEGAVAALTEAEIAYQRSLRGTPKDIHLVSAAEAERAKGMKTPAQLLEEQRKKEEALRKAEQARTKALEDAKRAEEAYTRELKKHDDALDDLVNSFGGAGGQGAIGKANLYIQALHNAIPIEQMSAKAKRDIHQAMDDAIVSYQAAGKMAPQEMYKIWLATKNATEGVIEFSSKWKNFTDIVTTKPLDLGKGFQMADPKTYLTPWKDAFTSFADTLPAIFGKAMSARGGNMGKVLAEQLTAGLSTEIASAIAKGMSGTTAQNNMAAGMGVGIVAAMFSDVFRSIVESRGAAEKFQQALAEMTRDMHADLVGPNSPYRDFEALEEAANEVGLTFEDVWNPDGVTTFGHHLQERIDEFRRLHDESTAAFEYQQTALALLAETVQKYGFTLEELGPAMQRQELDKQAQQLFKDWEVLNSAGIDTIAITERMADAVNDYVADALSMGMEIPSAMRPMLESFVKAGTLLDANGNAITDLEDSGISFAMTMSEGFTRLIDTVRELTDAISRGLGLAIENIPAPEIEGTVRWHVEGIPQVNDRPGGGLAPEYAKGTDGFVNFGKGTPVILHGWEAVVPRDQANATVTGGGGPAALGGGMMTVIVEADGRQLSRIVAPFLPGEVRRLGLARG